jgi:virginiamycin B lyase
LVTTGAFTEYALPASGDGPVGIAMGPDHALWFTEYYSNDVGRVERHEHWVR